MAFRENYWICIYVNYVHGGHICRQRKRYFVGQICHILEISQRQIDEMAQPPTITMCPS